MRAPPGGYAGGVKGVGVVWGWFLGTPPHGAPWHVLLHEPSMIRDVTFEMTEEEFRRLLEANHLALPGEPGFQLP